MILLQTQVSGTLDTVSIGTWMIGGLLALILILIGVIWQDNKAQSLSKHQDLVTLIDKLDGRQDELDHKQRIQELQLHTLDVAIKMMQGHPIDLTYIKPQEKPHERRD
ncbi:hypothetical protein [Nibribacter koreensis]|uniref:Phage shock protein B n=1 Tax=Nibribacter koreensis TaxID=1084519 RepID=A0ABP8FBL1_9BACT